MGRGALCIMSSRTSSATVCNITTGGSVFCIIRYGALMVQRFKDKINSSIAAAYSRCVKCVWLRFHGRQYQTTLWLTSRKKILSVGVLWIDWLAYYTNLNFLEHVCVNDFLFLIIHTNNTIQKFLILSYLKFSSYFSHLHKCI